MLHVHDDSVVSQQPSLWNSSDRLTSGDSSGCLELWTSAPLGLPFFPLLRMDCGPIRPCIVLSSLAHGANAACACLLSTVIASTVLLRQSQTPLAAAGRTPERSPSGVGALPSGLLWSWTLALGQPLWLCAAVLPFRDPGPSYTVPLFSVYLHLEKSCLRAMHRQSSTHV